MGRQLILTLRPKKTFCHYCQRPIEGKEVTMDHVVPKIRGGTWERHNILWSCVVCNGLKSDKPYDRFVFLSTLVLITHHLPLDDSAASKEKRRKYASWWHKSVRRMEDLLTEEPRAD